MTPCFFVKESFNVQFDPSLWIQGYLGQRVEESELAGQNTIFTGQDSKDRAAGVASSDSQIRQPE